MLVEPMIYDVRSSNTCYCNCCPGRLVRKVFGILLIHTLEMVHAAEVDIHLDDLVQARAGRLEYGA